MDQKYTDLVKDKLERFKQRYFAWGKSPDEDGRVAHFMACDIYRAKEVYGFSTCTCGLLYDLRSSTPDGFSYKMFPPYGEQSGDQERTWEEQKEWDGMSKEQKDDLAEKNMALLEKAFKFNKIDPEEASKRDTWEWTVIQEVFGPNFRNNTERIYEKYIEMV